MNSTKTSFMVTSSSASNGCMLSAAYMCKLTMNGLSHREIQLAKVQCPSYGTVISRVFLLYHHQLSKKYRTDGSTYTPLTPVHEQVTEEQNQMWVPKLLKYLHTHTKWNHSYNDMVGFVKSRISLAIIWFLHGSHRTSRRFTPVIQAGCKFDAMAGIAKW